MYKVPLSTAFAAALLLAACGGGGKNDDAGHGNQPARTAAVTTVEGSVTLRTPAPLSPAAKLTVQILNVSQKPASVLVEKAGEPVSAMPATFKLDFDPAKIDQGAFYVVDAAIVDGERRYVSARQYPVITKGAPARVDVQLNPEPTAGEKVEEEYRLLERAIGGMKRTQGSSEEEKSTTAWDGFFDKSGLRYIREITDLGDKGRINTFFAYRANGQPMLVFRENVPAMSERASASSRAAWDEQGNLVVKVHRDGANAGVLSDADAKALQERARALYDMVSKRKP